MPYQVQRGDTIAKVVDLMKTNWKTLPGGPGRRDADDAGAGLRDVDQIGNAGPLPERLKSINADGENDD